MDKMSLFSILTVSVPEAILNIYLGFVLTGLRNRLYLDDKLNLLRLIIAVPLMVLTAVTARALIPNIMFVPLINTVLYIIILKFVYRLKWFDSFLCVVIFVGFLATIESTYIFQFVAFVSKSVKDYYSNDIVRLISSVPERILQFIVIISFWKWDLVYLTLRGKKKVLTLFFALAFIILAVEAGLSFSFVCNLDKFSDIFKIVFSILCFLLGFVNFLICKIIIMLCKDNNTENSLKI